MNKKTWGNAKYIAKILIVTFGIYAVIQLCAEYAIFIYEVHTCSLLLISVIFAIPTFVIYFKLRGKVDMFHSRKEIGYQCVVMLLFFGINALAFATESGTIFYQSEVTQSSIHHSHLVVRELPTSCTVFTSAFITIYAIHKEMMKLGRNSELFRRRNRMAKPNAKSAKSISGVHAMLKTISNHRGFKAFMQHLVEYTFLFS